MKRIVEPSEDLIHGVRVKPLRLIPDERGRLMEILRCDDEEFIKFGQVYMTTNYPGIVKGWHYHTSQIDNVVCVKGMIKLVLYDRRETSPTYDRVNEFFLGEYNHQLIQIPNEVLHGWKCVSETESIVINVPTEVFIRENPDEGRVDYKDENVPYDWDIRIH